MTIRYTFIHVHVPPRQSLPSFANPHLNPCLLPRPRSPSYPFFSSSCLPAVIAIGRTPCFDAGFDRFVCGRIHSARIRKSTGRKMEICLQTLRPALGAAGARWKRKKKRKRTEKPRSSLGGDSYRRCTYTNKTHGGWENLSVSKKKILLEFWFTTEREFTIVLLKLFFFFPAGCFVNRHVIYVSFGIETWVLFAPRSSYPVE